MCNTKERYEIIFCLQPVLILYSTLISKPLNQSLHCRLELRQRLPALFLPESCSWADLGCDSSALRRSSVEAKRQSCRSSLLVAGVVLVASWFAARKMVCLLFTALSAGAVPARRNQGSVQG